MTRPRVLFLCTHNSARSESGHRSKRYEDVATRPWDFLITVCDDANERCPFVPGSVKRLHWSFDDPSRAAGTDEQRLAVFRRVRDQIRERTTAWLREQPA